MAEDLNPSEVQMILPEHRYAYETRLEDRLEFVDPRIVQLRRYWRIIVFLVLAEPLFPIQRTFYFKPLEPEIHRQSIDDTNFADLE